MFHGELHVGFNHIEVVKELIYLCLWKSLQGVKGKDGNQVLG